MTIDETWIDHITLESNRLSTGESHPKQPKTQTSAGKVLASLFWDAQGNGSLITLKKEEPSIANII